MKRLREIIAFALGGGGCRQSVSAAERNIDPGVRLTSIGDAKPPKLLQRGVVTVIVRELTESDHRFKAQIHRLRQRHKIDRDLSWSIEGSTGALARDPGHPRSDVPIQEDDCLRSVDQFCIE